MIIYDIDDGCFFNEYKYVNNKLLKYSLIWMCFENNY